MGMDVKEVKQNIWFKNHGDWTAIIERTYPTSYRIKNMTMNSNKTMWTLNTIESKWLDEYDQAIQSLRNFSFPDE